MPTRQGGHNYLIETGQLVIRFTFHELCDVVDRAFYSIRMPMSASGLLFVHYVEYEHISVCVQIYDLTVSLADDDGAIDREVLVKLGSGRQSQIILVF